MRILLLLFFTLMISHLPNFSVSLNNEGRYLMDLKNGLEDPSNMLANWDERDRRPCNWTGITCGSTSSSFSSEVVTSVNLTNYGLTGPFPTSLCRLPNLSFLSLQLNFINGSLTNSSLSSCSALLYLDLSFNLLVGPLPDSLPSHLPVLRHLDLSSNNFTGPIPPSFALFPRLVNLTLVYNLLTSTIPSFLANLSTLQQLNLSYNLFDPGTIPPSFGNLSSLRTLWLAGCGLVGSIPPALGSLPSLTNLDLTYNSLTGRIPNELTGLASIVQIELYNNSLSGPLPPGLSNLTALRRIDASSNHLDGPLPADLFEVPLLDNLHLYQNRITGGIPPAVSRSKTLVELRLFGNALTGTLPADLGSNNSPLMFIDLADNHLSGEIPASICDRGLLQQLLLVHNSFSGTIPDGLARCRTLTRLRLSNNNFSGDVPPGLWGLPRVSLLGLDGNSFSGPISPTISGAHDLSKLTISDNRFTGTIPPEIGLLPSLYHFSAADNALTGPIPPSLGGMTQLGQLDLHNNSLTGGLLTDINSWKKLTLLNLADNDLTGTIPPQLGNLPVLNYLDLSGNILDGEIPTQLQNLKLDRFNLSDNQLSGSIPPMYKSDAYRTSFLDNPGLCGELAGLCPGLPRDSHGHGRLSSSLLASIFVLGGILLLVIGVGWFYLRYRKFNKAKLGSDKSKWTLTSFHKLGFSEYEILDCLDEDNVIGSGASGKVYKAVLSSGEAVAVKKLWGNAKDVDKAEADAFKAEVATLGNIRHKNIVKLWCTCSHKDCNLLVFEYMPNGSLGDLLHNSRKGKGGALDWPTRYKIALDAAEGLSYLHHDCVPAIVHRDIKSNNILLDADFGARVADFGVAKVMEAVENGPKSMSVIAGSCGYIAPEYAYTLRVTEKSDIYSFGVVILELVTGKRPIDPEFGEKDLVKWVCGTLEQKGGIIDHVVDTKLDLSLYKEEISKFLNIGLLCTSSLPISRPSMRRIVKMLLELDEDDAKSKSKTKQQEKEQEQEQEQDEKLSILF